MADSLQTRIAACLAAGEAAYDRMYDARDYDLSWQIELATDAFREAHRLALDAGLDEQAADIMARLQHVKAVGRQLRTP